MAITTTTLADDSFKTIIKANGLGGETKEKLLDASILSGATSSPNLSIAHLYYEILGTGNLTFFFGLSGILRYLLLSYQLFHFPGTLITLKNSSIMNWGTLTGNLINS